MNKNKKKKYKRLVWRSILFWTVMFFYVLVVSMYIGVNFYGKTIMDALSSSRYWLTGLSVCALMIAGYYSIKGVYGYMKAYNEETKEKPFWLERNKLKRLGFKLTDWTKTGATNTGHVIGVEETSKGLKGVVSNSKTTAVLGCLAGATAKAHLGFNLDKWQNEKSKPTVFVFDTKKEILNNYNRGFEEAGYELYEIDLDKPEFVNGWNPFATLIEKVEPIKDLTNGLESKDGKYQGAGETFQTYKDARERLQVLQSELVWHIQSLLDAIFPKYNGSEAEEDAKTIVLGIMIAFTEDYVSGKMQAKEFNIYSLVNAMRKGVADTEQLRKYLISNRTKYSLAKMTVKDVFADVKALKYAMGVIHKYEQDLNDDSLLISISGDNTLSEKAQKPRVVFIRLSTETGMKERIAKLFLKQACLKEQQDYSVRFVVKDNLPIALYEPFIIPLKDKKLDGIFELNTIKEIQEYYGDLAVGFNAWFDEKLWFHGAGKEIEYIELCKDNITTTKTKLETPLPVIHARVLDKAKDEDVALTSIKGLKPIFTTFALYVYGDEGEPKIARVVLEEVMNNVYDITLFQRDF